MDLDFKRPRCLPGLFIFCAIHWVSKRVPIIVDLLRTFTIVSISFACNLCFVNATNQYLLKIKISIYETVN